MQFKINKIISVILLIVFSTCVAAHDLPYSQLYIDMKSREDFNSVYLSLREGLFDEFKNQKEDIRTWDAIHHFRSFTDASGTKEYYDFLFSELRKNNLLYYRKYMDGYDKALDLMVYALNYEWTYDDKSPQSFIEKMFKKIQELKPKNNGKNLERHKMFIKKSYGVYGEMGF